MIEDIESFVVEINETIAEISKFCYFVRDIKFQQESILILRDLIERIVVVRKEAARASDEDQANRMFGAEMFLHSLINELDMWIALKEDRPDEAWNSLVEAQSRVEILLGFNVDINNLKSQAIRLFHLEKLLFPPQLFMSSGTVETAGTCSICSSTYGECGHIKGRAYMGELCVRIVDEILSVTEVSIVKNPADKRCRAFEIPDGNVSRDAMTWEIKDN